MAKPSHVVTLALVFAALLALVLLTYAAAHLPLGALAIPVAYAIATAKALLILSFFMELRTQEKLQRVAAGVGFLWLFLLFYLALADYLTRDW